MPTQPLGRYLWDRIKECGTKTIMSVPGDFQLELLDYVYAADLHLVGNSNELNATYAADGYARASGTPGAVITTHGVGELSALNGLAGSRAEHVGVIHVVGQPPRRLWAARAAVHHALDLRSDYDVYTRTSAPISAATAQLWEPAAAPAQIDWVVRECVLKRRPVWVYVPLDIVGVEVPVPGAPLDLSVPVDEEAETAAAKAVVEALKGAERPGVLLDALVHRYGAEEEGDALVKKLGLPVFGSMCSKGWVDEESELFAGTYLGSQSADSVQKAWESCDLKVVLGDWPTDANTGGFSRKMDEQDSIRVGEDEVVVQGTKYPRTRLRSVLTKLLTLAPSLAHTRSTPLREEFSPFFPIVAPSSPTTPLAQSWIWHRLAAFLLPGDTVISDVGTSQFALATSRWPGRVRYHTQTFYASIGWALASTMGVARARAERGEEPGRTICVTGDGAMALTIQEIGTMIWEELNPIVILVNNGGYLVEKVIHGAHQRYNDIAPTDYTHLLPLYRHPRPHSAYHVVRNSAEADAVFDDPRFQKPETVQLIELVLDKMDLSEIVVTLMRDWRGEQTLEKMREAGFTGDERLKR